MVRLDNYPPMEQTVTYEGALTPCPWLGTSYSDGGTPTPGRVSSGRAELGCSP